MSSEYASEAFIFILTYEAFKMDNIDINVNILLYLSYFMIWPVGHTNSPRPYKGQVYLFRYIQIKKIIQKDQKQLLI